MSYHSRMILPPGSGPSRKRKEREDKQQKQQQQQPFYYSSLNPSSAHVPRAEPILFKPSSPSSSEPRPSSNQLLAGYMAHEFLTKGTLLGQKFDPARADSAEPQRIGAESYADVANLLKGDEAHIKGVVNPTQLAQWIQM